MNDTLLMLDAKHRHSIRIIMKTRLHKLEGDLSFCKDMIALHWNNSDPAKPHSITAFKLLNHYKDYARKLRKELKTIRSILQVMK
jgi:hypothetical protein